MKNTNKFLIYNFIFAIALLSLPLIKVNAATIGFSPASGSYKVGDTINVKVYVNSESKSINAVSANIKYPSDILSLSSVSKVGSIINLWAQEPSFSNANNTASLEGVVLNGYTGSSGNIVTLVFRVKTAGVASLKFNSASILANDGNGTEVLSNKGASVITISDIKTPTPIVVEKKTTVSKVETPIVKAPVVKDTTIIISEIKNNTSSYSLNKFLITSPQPIIDKSYSIQIDSMPAIVWTDDGTHIYQASELTNGDHVIKVMASDANSNALSGFLNFSSTVLKVPTITYYPTDLYVDQFLVLKGTADPMVDIELTIANIVTGETDINHVSTNSDGKFIYVSENKMQAGTYSILVRSSTLNNIYSSYMDPMQIVSKEYKLNFFVSKFNSYLMILIPLIALIFFIFIMVIYLNHHAKKIQKSLSKKFMDTENIISKSFEILDEDADEEIAIFRKIREYKILDKDEQVFLTKFKKDIKEAEKIIQKELKEVEKAK